MEASNRKSQHSALRLIIKITVILLIVLLLKLLMNLVADKTTQTSPNVYVSRLVGQYVERNANHRPMQNPATIEFKQIFENGEPSKYVVFSYVPNNELKSINIVFESLKVSNIFTPEDDKIFGFDGVLRPIRFLDDSTLNDLSSSDNDIHINMRKVFPEGCEFRTYNASLGGNLAYRWKTTKKCNSPSAQFYIHGILSRNGVALHTKLEIRTYKGVIKINTNGYNAYFRQTSDVNN